MRNEEEILEMAARAYVSSAWGTTNQVYTEGIKAAFEIFKTEYGVTGLYDNMESVSRVLEKAYDKIYPNPITDKIKEAREMANPHSARYHHSIRLICDALELLAEREK